MKALEQSIEHWLNNEQALTAEDAAVCAEACALCENFMGNGCRGCPVYNHTGRTLCAKSPYIEASRKYTYWLWEEQEQHPFISNWQKREAFHLAAKAERIFLESLREKV